MTTLHQRGFRLVSLGMSGTMTSSSSSASDPPSNASTLPSSSTQLTQDSISALEYITQQEELGITVKGRH